MRQTANTHFEFSQWKLLPLTLVHIFKILTLTGNKYRKFSELFFVLFLPIVNKRWDKSVCMPNHNSKETGLKKHAGIYASTYIISKWKWFYWLDRRKLSDSQLKQKTGSDTLIPYPFRLSIFFSISYPPSPQKHTFQTYTIHQSSGNIYKIQR